MQDVAPTLAAHTQLLAESVSLGRACAAAKMRLDSKAPVAMQEAYRAYTGPKSVPDYFGRKWLSLRLSALKRGMVVDLSVTPDFLRLITPASCPVTGEPIETDGKSRHNPSVDRLVNEAGYVAGNVCVLSVRANRAKGELSFEEVVQLTQAGEAKGGLESHEWLRLCSLMYGAWARAYKQSDPYLIPLAVLPARGMFMSTSQVVQMLLMNSFRPGGPTDAATATWLQRTVEAGVDESVFIELRDRLLQAQAAEGVDATLSSTVWTRPGVFEALAAWYPACQSVVARFVEAALQRQQDHVGDPNAQQDLLSRPRHQH